jgi:hypothetical protein
MEMQKLITSIFILLLLVFPSCFTTFKVTKDNINAEGSTIAILAGNNHEANLSMAILVTEQLDKISKFKVLSQKEIATSLEAYPVRIQGPWSRAYFNIDEDFTKTDVEKLKAMQKRIGAKYVYVLWMPVTTRNQFGQEILYSISQMYEFPEGVEIGRGGFNMMKNTNAWNQAGMTKKDLMDQFAQKVALDISEQMQMKK